MSVTTSTMRLSHRKDWITHYQFAVREAEWGRVHSVSDGIVWIEGLASAAIDEIILFADGSRGLVFTLRESLVGAILLEESDALCAGMCVNHYRKQLSTVVGDRLLGRVINPLGLVLDNEQPTVLEDEPLGLIDQHAPAITERDFVNQPMFTGNKIVDTLIPIGKGQRQLLIGDNGTGKTTFAIDTIINQQSNQVICVLVLIGQKRSTVLSTIDILRKMGAMAYTTVVVAEATALPGLQYLAPFAATTMGEYWMRQGKDVLIIYDDLTAHAKAYRELSLLLRRPPGREAYPPDIFYLHSRLLERATCLAKQYGGGSLTALPIIETKEGELASYIPTNLISITDGQIVFDTRLFASGFLPAIDITRSVSRVGGKAQRAELKKEAGRMKLDYLQFLELEVFTKFGAQLEPEMQKKIQRGMRLRELLKQPRLQPFSPEQQLAWLQEYNRS